LKALRRIGGLVLLGATLTALGCSKDAQLSPLANQRPTVQITQAPTDPQRAFFYAYEIRWAGFDDDGRIDHFLYCVDPPTEADVDTPWVKTTENRQTFLFQSENADSLASPTAKGFHTFVLKAVDDRGGLSAPESRSFTSFTVTPTVKFVNPTPNHLLSPTYGPSIRLNWSGTDPDGRTTTKPVYYKFKVFAEDNREFDFLTMLVRPDSLRKYYAPDFAGWDSLGATATGIDIRDLLPDKRYVAVVVAFDEAGAYSPVFNYDVNMLYFNVSYAGLLGPRFTVYNEAFYYQYPSGGISLDPTGYIRAELPADQIVRINWFATPSSGGFISGYRWMIDGDIGDESPRTNEASDLKRWSQWSTLATGVRLPAFTLPPGVNTETHYFYIEARDNVDQISLSVVEFTLVRATFEKELLFVDDTRFNPDVKLSNGNIDRPKGSWPTAAELDTFMFARGGMPWRTYPAGIVSPPGVFSGYAYDTVGTRHVRDGVLRLSELARYRHIVWYADQKGASFDSEPFLARDPMSSLRYMAMPSHANNLATWVAQGGKLWLMGGGAATCLQTDWEKLTTSSAVFSNADGELVPGRFMYDLVRWRSEISVGSTSQAVKATRGYGRWPGAPSYQELPDYLSEKSAATDPISVYAPNRTNQSDYYRTNFVAEAITKSNTVSEQVPGEPDGVLASPLDTLYYTVGGSLGSERVVMTVYRGGDGAPVVFSGFPLWYFQRDAQIAILDWVLQRLWGLPRQNVPR